MQTQDQKKPKAGPAGRSFSDKAMAKIQMASRPTKSKMIVKGGSMGGGRGGRGRGGSGGRGGRGGSRGRGR